MRLTLRTLLAYLDEMLEPNDAQDIGRRIEESEFATALMNRVRDVGRKLRLGSPAPMGKGLGGDANSVAEYLDNCMASERVPEFEKICLESDVQLGEVSGCHQILTLVLGEPATVPPDCRRRMYRLPADAEARAAAAAAPRSPPVESNGVEKGPVPAAEPPASPAAEVETPEKKRDKPEIPDYLREPERAPRTWRKWVVAACLLLALGGAVVMTVAPESWQLAMNLGGSSNSAPVAQPAPTDLPDTGPLTAPPARPELPPAGDPAKSPPPKETKPGEPGPSEPGPGEPGPGEPKPSEPKPGERAPGEPAPGEPKPGEPKPGEPKPGEPKPGEPKPGEPKPGEPKPGEPKPPGDEPMETVEALGRVVSAGEVVLVSRADEPAWQRMGLAKSLAPGDELLALPPFKPSLALSSGLTLHLVGGTRVGFPAAAAGQASPIRIAHGRVLILTVGKPNLTTAVKFGDRSGQLILVNAETSLAVNVVPLHSAGADPEGEPDTFSVELYVVAGQIRFAEAEASLRADAGGLLRLVTGRAGEVIALQSPPDWITLPEPQNAEKLAAGEVEKTLRAEARVDLTLKELADSRRQEVVSLALRGLGSIGEFDDLVAAFRSSDQQVYWPRHLETVREAIARDKATATRVREAFLRQRRDDAGALFRMLWGYTNDQLTAGEARHLVDFLNSDHLDYRVLAYLNLREIAGMTLGYNPTYIDLQRTKYVNRWRDQLERGEIRYKAPGAAPPLPQPTETPEPAKPGE